MSIQGIKATLLPDEAIVLDDGFDSYDDWLLAVRRGEVSCFGKLHWSVVNDHDAVPDYVVVDGKCFADPIGRTRNLVEPIIVYASALRYGLI